MYTLVQSKNILLISTIQHAIADQINIHPIHTYILYEDFHRDIALMSKQNYHQITPPQATYYQWNIFTYNLEITYIPTHTIFSKQGGHNYIKNMWTWRFGEI